MVSVKTFMKIRYPEFENERIFFTPIRPDIEKLVRSNHSFIDLPDLLVILYKAGDLIKKV
jgi:hypothetical protein